MKKLLSTMVRTFVFIINDDKLSNHVFFYHPLKDLFCLGISVKKSLILWFVRARNFILSQMNGISSSPHPILYIHLLFMSLSQENKRHSTASFSEYLRNRISWKPNKLEQKKRGIDINALKPSEFLFKP